MANEASSPSAVSYAIDTVAKFVGGGVIVTVAVALTNRFRKWRMARAQVVLNLAQARQVDGDTVLRATERHEELIDIIYNLNFELARERIRADRAEFEKDTAIQNEEWAVMQMEAIYALAKIKGVHLADYTPRQVKRAVLVTKQVTSGNGEAEIVLDPPPSSTHIYDSPDEATDE